MCIIPNLEFEKLKVFNVEELNNYLNNEIVIQTIIKKPTGTMRLAFFDKGEELEDTLSRFDNFVQIIEGKAEVIIDDISYKLDSGEFIIIPANSKNIIKANEKLKLISTIIKSGYE